MIFKGQNVINNIFSHDVPQNVDRRNARVYAVFYNNELVWLSTYQGASDGVIWLNDTIWYNDTIWNE